MSFDNDPPPLPPQGHLLEALGYFDEGIAAIAINVAEQTLIEYRKAGIGPDFTVVGRTILYSRESLQRWLEAGGTRAAIERGMPLTVMPRVKSAPKAKPAKAAATDRVAARKGKAEAAEV